MRNILLKCPKSERSPLKALEGEGRSSSGGAGGRRLDCAGGFGVARRAHLIVFAFMLLEPMLRGMIADTGSTKLT